MKSKKRTIGILIVVIVVLLGFAGSLLVYRNKLSSENKKNNSDNNTTQSLSSAPSGKSIENFYDKPITDEKIALDSIEVNRNKLGYSDKNFTFIYDKKSGSETSYHFDLYYKGIPVYGGGGNLKGVGVFTHYNDNSAKILMTSVSDSEKITKVNTTPKITEDEASNIIKNKINEEINRKPELIIYETNNEYYLSYCFDGSYLTCIINAENGEVITCHSNLIFGSAEYSGQNGDIHQVFYNDYKNEKYDVKNALWDNEKNIFIINNRSDYNYDSYNNNLFKLEDIQLDKNKSAVDGMANTYRAVEYFDKHFDKKFDITYVCVNVDNCTYADGTIVKDNACGRYINNQNKEISCLIFCVSSNAKNPQGSAYLDTVSHEYTHTITASIFGTSYGKEFKYHERNALMEAYSDIFGELIEAEYTGKTDWYHNEERSLIKHEDTDNKKDYTYKYSQKYQTTDSEGTENNDYGGAHYNSTIISHTAYLMSKDNENKKKKYDAEFLLDYNQLAQLWYGSLEYLKKTDFMDFADCRWAIEESARDLIKNGVLLENNLKIIEQAFNEVEVSSNPTRRGLTDSMKIIKDKNTIVVPIEDETQSTEIVEIQELNYTWRLEPTIEAEDIILSDKEEVREGNQQNYKYASSEYAVIKNNFKYGVIKYDGTLLTDVRYKSFCMPYNKEMWIINENSHENPDDIIITPNANSPSVNFNLATSVGFMDYYYTYSKDKNKLFIDGHDFESYFNVDYNVVIEETEEIYGNSQNKNARYGIADKNGIIIPCEYENACMNIGNNIIALEKGGKWGYFDKNGTKIIDFICEPFESKVLDDTWRKASWDKGENYPYLATNDYIPVKINGKCGYYDTKGNEVIPCGTFEEVRPVHNGLAWVKKDGKWGVIKLKKIETETNTGDNNSYVNIKDYEGRYYPINSDYCISLNISNITENSAEIYIEFTNGSGTKVSQNSYIGNIDSNIFTFETDDGFGKNSFTLEFQNDKIILNGKCVDCYSQLWGIPEMNQIEMQIN